MELSSLLVTTTFICILESVVFASSWKSYFLSSVLLFVVIFRLFRLTDALTSFTSSSGVESKANIFTAPLPHFHIVPPSLSDAGGPISTS